VEEEENLLLMLDIHEVRFAGAPPFIFSELLRLNRPGRRDVALEEGAAGFVAVGCDGTAFAVFLAGCDSAGGVTDPGYDVAALGASGRCCRDNWASPC